MKKIISILLITLTLLSVVVAEPIVFKIKGPESEYNQIRIKNRTSYKGFDCKVVFLKQEGENTYRQTHEYGRYYLKGYGDIDSVTDRVRRGQIVSLKLSDEMENNVEYKIVYEDHPFFDVVNIVLYDADSDEDEDEILSIDDIDD